jgi:NADH-quinone oxidoreductase subunit A
MLAQVSVAVSTACSGGEGCYSDFVRQYLTVAILGAVAVGLVAGMLAVAAILRPVHRSGKYQEQKRLIYESGVDAVGSGWGQSQVRYYVFALLFVMFDVEAVFIFPWAAQLESYDTFGLIEMFAFMGLLVLGLVYAWR